MDKRIVIVKPGKEAHQYAKGEKKVKNKFDTLPLVVDANDQRIRLPCQQGEEVTLGELARELAKIRRVNKSVWKEVSAALIRMACYWKQDHQKTLGAWAWSPHNISRITQLDTEMKKHPSEIVILDFLISCHAISFQEDIKYAEHPKTETGRYNTLTSLIYWSVLLANDGDHELKLWNKEVDSALVGRPASGIALKTLKERFSECIVPLEEKTEWLLILQESSKEELKERCKSNGLKVGGNMSELRERLEKHHYSPDLNQQATDIAKQIVKQRTD